MQAVILAAGKSTRTYPLTLTRPKPLLKAANRTLLEHNLDNLNGIVDEAILVVGYKKGMIKKHIGNKYKNIKIRYIEQKSQLGTGNALLMAEKHIKGSFISLHGDDIYSGHDFKNAAKRKYSILTARVKNPKSFGVIIQKNNILTELIEKPQRFVSDLANTGLYKLDKGIFVLLKKLIKSKRNEYELTDAIRQLARQEKVYCVKSGGWIPVGYPSDLLKADKALRKSKNSIGNNARISGIARNSSIGNGCIIEGNVRNSIVMDGAIIDKGSVVENSIIGQNAHLSGRILNSVVADNAELKNVVVKNCKIWPNKAIQNKIVEKDAT
ncbi:NTP transferase domain-containing protein [Candidatus Woesearchaeota archaeon]|nr:NTP transferase domain-containing protein [Candidatus Woesearchaeota archaeon]